MPQIAYDLDYFAPAPKAPQPKRKRRVRVAHNPKAGRKRLFNACAMLLLLVLVVGVLGTRAKLTELQGNINYTQRQLREAKSSYDSLNLTLDSSVNIVYVEEKAKELGLIKMESGHVSYVRATNGSNIEVAKTGFAKWVDGAQNSFLDMIGYFTAAPAN